jgi:hypothetical protein
MKFVFVAVVEVGFFFFGFKIGRNYIYILTKQKKLLQIYKNFIPPIVSANCLRTFRCGDSTTATTLEMLLLLG